MKQKIFVRLSALMLLTALAFAGCASNQPAASKAEPQEASSGATSSSETAPSEAASSQAASGTFTVYTSVPQTLIDEYKGEFSKKYPELTVNVYQAVTNDILSKLKAEKEAGSIGADIVWVADEASAVLLKEQGYLESYTSTEDAGIPDSMKDKDRSYYGSRVINMVLAYNTQATSAPTSWKDLLDPKFKGKIGLPNVTSGTSYTFVGDLAASPDFGWEFFQQMKDNGGMRVKANNDAVTKLSSGEFVLTACLDYMIKAAKDKGSPVDYVIPKEGAIMVVSPICLVAGGKNPAGGRQFIDYVLSKEGQELQSKQNVVSVRSDIVPPSGVPSIQDIQAFPADNAYLNSGREEINEKFEKIFG